MGIEGKMNKLAIISDIHGCYETLLALIAKIPPDHRLVFAGDLMDRGPRSKEVIKYAMSNRIPTVMGNHEHLMLHHYGKEKGFYNHPLIWMYNGGIFTTESFQGNVPNEVLQWTMQLPFSLKFDNLLISHTGHGLNDNPIIALWERGRNFPEDGLYRVFGHTPEEEPVITDNWAMIDTGCAYKSHGYGNLTAFLWPEKQIIKQEYCETKVKSDEDL